MKLRGGMSQKDLAKALGFAESQVTHKIKARNWKRIQESTWTRMLDWFGYTVPEGLAESVTWSKTSQGRSWLKGTVDPNFSENPAAALAELRRQGKTISSEALLEARRVDRAGRLLGTPADSVEAWIQRFLNYQEAQESRRTKAPPKVPDDLVPTRPAHKSRSDSH